MSNLDASKEGSCFTNAKSSTITLSSNLHKLHPLFRDVVEALGKSETMIHQSTLPLTRVESSKGEQLMHALIYTEQPEDISNLGIHINSSFRGFVTAMVRPSDLLDLANTASVRYVRPAEINFPDNNISRVETGAYFLHEGFINDTPYKGKDVIVLIYDSGIDWKHLDFRDPNDTTKSRILYIWDQTLDSIENDLRPLGFNYGVEYTKAQIEDEIDGTPAGFVREKDIDGHGTHVAGTAVGNGQTFGKFSGMAPEADIIVVKGGNGWYSDVGMIDCFTYAMNKAEQLKKPIVLNMSLGTMWGPHDASHPVAIAADSFASEPGRIHVNSAGNSGLDLIHIGGTIQIGESKDINISVPPYTKKPGFYNDYFGLILWFNDPDTVSAKLEITSPYGNNGICNWGEFYFSNDTAGRVYVANRVSEYNGQRYFYIWVEDADTAKPPAPGNWKITLSNVSKTVSYDGWLNNATIGSDNKKIILENADAEKTVNAFIPYKTILVGSYFTRYSWPYYSTLPGEWGRTTSYFTTGERLGDISPWSSKGPSRDGRTKPDIVAPGQVLISTLSADGSFSNTSIYPQLKYTTMAGTSTSAPIVTGCIALLLEHDPSLTAEQVKTYLTSTTSTDTYTGTIPNNTFGYGKINICRALSKLLNPETTFAHTIYRYDKVGIPMDTSYLNLVVTLWNTQRYALRFTPNISGTLAGIFYNVRWTNLPTNASLVCEVFTDTIGSISGIPGSRIGDPISIPVSQIDYYTINYIDLLSKDIYLTSSTNYHIVLSLQNATDYDYIDLITDDGSANADNRTSINVNEAWYNSGETQSGLNNKNIRIWPVVIAEDSSFTKVKNIARMPFEYTLKHNYPNPFNQNTIIEFSLAEKENVILKIYDLLGREIKTLVDGECEAGVLYKVNFDASRLSSGIYFCRLQTAKMSLVKKLILIR